MAAIFRACATRQPGLVAAGLFNFRLILGYNDGNIIYCNLVALSRTAIDVLQSRWMTGFATGLIFAAATTAGRGRAATTLLLSGFQQRCKLLLTVVALFF